MFQWLFRKAFFTTSFRLHSHFDHKLWVNWLLQNEEVMNDKNIVSEMTAEFFWSTFLKIFYEVAQVLKLLQAFIFFEPAT